MPNCSPEGKLRLNCVKTRCTFSIEVLLMLDFGLITDLGSWFSPIMLLYVLGT